MLEGETDPRLKEAAARSPDVAALLAGKHDDHSARYRRLALAVAGVAVAVGLLWLAVGSFPGARTAKEKEKPREAAEEIDRSHYLGPLATAPAGPGEEVAPFSGFAISVDTEPSGALVAIAGVPRGEAPVLANVDCRSGAKLEISAEKAGFRPARAQTACREDALVKITLRLSR